MITFSAPQSFQPLRCKSWVLEMGMVTKDLWNLERKGISQGAPTCHLMHSRADVMPLGRAVLLWQEQDNVCAECLYHLNFSSNATNASGKLIMFLLEGTTVTLKTWSFQNTAWVYCEDCHCLSASTEWLILRKNTIVHFTASVVLY